MLPRWFNATLAGCVLLVSIGFVSAKPDEAEAVGARPERSVAEDSARAATNWLTSRQNPNGSFGPGSGSADSTAEAAASAVSGGASGDVVELALDYITTHGPSSTTDAGKTGRLIVALLGLGVNPADFGGYNYVERLASFYNPALGNWDNRLYANALATLAHASVFKSLSDAAIRFWDANACEGGGWSHEAACGRGPDTDTTAVAMMGLIHGGNSQLVSDARRHLERTQTDGGGWGLEAGDPLNANSTGLALSALALSGQDIYTAGDGDPVAALRSLQLANGAFSFMAKGRENFYATVQAIPGLVASGYPVVALRTSSKNSPPGGQPLGSGGKSSSRAAGDSSADTSSGEAISNVEGPNAGTPGLEGAVGIIVDFGDREIRECVDIDDGDTALDVVEASVDNIVLQQFAFGSAVCSLDGTGCGQSNCLDCNAELFWSFWIRNAAEDEFVFSELGASNYVSQAGEIQAWVYGDGKTKPEEVDFSTICSAGATAKFGPKDAANRSTKSGGSFPVAPLIAVLALGAASLAVFVRRRSL